MGKTEKTRSPSPFDRFHKLTKALMSVPRKESQEKLAEYERQKKLKKRHLRTAR